MPLIESWATLDEFPEYAVSDLGRVMNLVHERLKMPHVNQQGIASVSLHHEGERHRRAVAVLVARAFLPEPIRPTYDTPINLNGDRTDNRADNLAWRPRWFAMEYHRMLLEPVVWGFNGTIYIEQTDEWFDNIREAAKKYGMLEREIIVAGRNNTPVFPHWFTIQFG